MKKNPIASPRFMLTALSSIVLATALSGCLSSGGGSSNSDGGGSNPAAKPPTAETVEGTVTGVELNGIQVYRGIPYASPPVGDLRFAPPAPPAERDATLKLSNEFANSCPQVDLTTKAELGNEDCLYLNVYAPKDAEGLPVMVWLHGGAFVFGDGGGEYDPTRLVNQDLVVVTLNYRLGNLGFMAHPALEADGGNFGLMDQQQALSWVKDNITSFGGDPEQVTLFGESAGGHSVLSHVVSPRAKEANLFQRAIIQSGSYAPFQLPKATAQLGGLGIAAALGCGAEVADAAACLRALPVSSLLAAQGSQAIPVVDPNTNLLPKSIMDALASGEFNTNLDIMIGSNQNEGTLFVALDELPPGEPLTSESEYRQRVADFLAPYQASIPYDEVQVADDYLGYFGSDPSPYSAALSGIWTDFMFACNSYAHSATFAAANMNTFQYWFRDENAPYTLVPPAYISFKMGATHAAEIPYVLYPEGIMQDRYAGDADDLNSLAGEMIDYWAQFAKNGDPNTSDGVAASWSQVSASGLMELDAPQSSAVSPLSFLGYHHCGYWAAPPLKL